MKNTDSYDDKDIEERIKLLGRLGQVGMSQLEKYIKEKNESSERTENSCQVIQDILSLFADIALRLYGEDAEILGLNMTEKELYLESHISLAAFSLIEDNARLNETKALMNQAQILYSPQLERKFFDTYSNYSPEGVKFLLKAFGDD
jgi:hypothetical protein